MRRLAQAVLQQTQEEKKYGDEIKSVVISDGVTAIPGLYFCDCISLRSITVPTSVRSIGASALLGNDRDLTVNYKGTKAQWSNITIDRDNNLSTAAIVYNYK